MNYGMDILRLASSCESLEKEFWYHVSPQDALPLAAAKPKLETADRLARIAKEYNEEKTPLDKMLVKMFLEDPSALSQLRKLVSVPDKRLYLDLSFIFSRTLGGDGSTSLCGCCPSNLTRHQTSYFINLLKKKDANALIAAEVIASYLLQKGLLEILEAYSQMKPAQQEAILSCLILPKEMQQVEAKLRGHGPEAELAKLMDFLGVNVVPEDKAKNPMGKHDPNVDNFDFTLKEKDPESTFSTDLIILDSKTKAVRICIVGLVHSSDPGQFGVDKANTVKSIRKSVDVFNKSQTNRTVELWGLVDGVGYSENKKGTINAMLPHFHHFLQINSLWKAAVRLHELGICKIVAIKFDKKFYSAELITTLSKYVPKDVRVLPHNKSFAKSQKTYRAGKATICVR